ncbi:uncharacterized protein LJ206_000007 isoform 6-T6 [Theristicus caerulescens]
MSLPRALRFRQRWQLCRTAQPWGGAGPPVQHQPVMVAGGSLAPVGLLWLCLAPAALLRLRQPQPILVVESGEPVEIGCEASEDMESKGNVLWYRRGGTDGLEQVLHCWSGTKGRFSCEYKRHKVTLRIAKASPEDAGIYLCAYNNGYRLDFGSGTALLVGGCPFRLSSTLGVAGVGVLLLLSLCLSICHLRRLRRLRHPTPVGHQPGPPMPPAPQEAEEELKYAQLIFAAPAGPRP